MHDSVLKTMASPLSCSKIYLR